MPPVRRMTAGVFPLAMYRSATIPDILNTVARAGSEGLILPEDPALAADLELCRRWGFPLSFERGRVFLPFDSDAMVPAWIEQEMMAIGWVKPGVKGFLEVGSTNEEALDLVRAGASGVMLICAEKQSAGRGRKGRRWISPPGAGIYSTVVIRPAQPPHNWPLLALAASVAVAEALNDVMRGSIAAGRSVIDLKWPNDVYLSGKKTAGILIETCAMRGEAPAAVVGIGINVRQGSIPEDLRDQATCLSEEAGEDIPRRKTLIHCLKHFQLCYDLFERGEHGELLDHWKRLSGMWKGVRVWIEDGGRRRCGTTCGITHQGALRVRNEDGTEETLLAADVTVRRA